MPRNFGRTAKKQERRARKDAERALETQQGEYAPPDRAELRLHRFHMPVDDPDTVEIDVRTWRGDEGVADFSISVKALTMSGEWVEGYEADCCHGEAHLHRRWPGEDEHREHIARLDSVKDVQDALNKSLAKIDGIARTLRDRRDIQ